MGISRTAMRKKLDWSRSRIQRRHYPGTKLVSQPPFTGGCGICGIWRAIPQGESANRWKSDLIVGSLEGKTEQFLGFFSRPMIFGSESLFLSTAMKCISPLPRLKVSLVQLIFPEPYFYIHFYRSVFLAQIFKLSGAWLLVAEPPLAAWHFWFVPVCSQVTWSTHVWYKTHGKTSINIIVIWVIIPHKQTMTFNGIIMDYHHLVWC